MAAIERPNSMTPDDASEPISLSRRRFLESSLAGLAAAIISPAVTAETAVAATHRITTDDDIERLLPHLSKAPGSVITPDDLEAAERAEAVAVGEGDILFIRNGAGAANTYELGTGLHPDCLAWLHERRIAVVSSDSDSDVHPPLPGFQRWSEPVHMIAIPYLGLPILDNTDLEEISRACAAERQWEFFVTAAPWRFAAPPARRSTPWRFSRAFSGKPQIIGILREAEAGAFFNDRHFSTRAAD